MAQITIDNQLIECNEGEYILNIARANGIFIPALCYLSGCTPTLACRLCVVEADGKRVYSCNAKAKDGMNITTDSAELNKERKAIMQTYCINHPIECGVCDKSGECELQNYVHLFEVDEVKYGVENIFKPTQNWGMLRYEPTLCILCERCVKVCKDKIGESALKVAPSGAMPLDKSLKESMQKEAYAVLNRVQKGTISIEGDKESLLCGMCGECSAVCPTGAIITTHFQYSSNSWELTKIPASNPHSSDCELIYYEVKEKGIENREKKIYRVSNDFCFGHISGAARFGFDFHKEKSSKNSIVFERIATKIQNGTIKTIKFNSFITNEEAYMLELLREKFNLNLINEEAKKYQDFLTEFSKFSGSNLYSGSSSDIAKSDFLVIAGSFLRYDAPNLSYKLNNALKLNKDARALYFHPLSDSVLMNYSKKIESVKHSPNLDIEILLWIAQNFCQNLPTWLDEKLKNEFSSEKKVVSGDEEPSKDEVIKISNYAKALGITHLNIDEIKESSSPLLIVGEDFIYSKNSLAIARVLGLIQKFSKFKVMIIPTKTNTLGVSLICKLSSKPSEKILGYNEDGDVKFDVYDGDLDAPALNQQDGSFTNYDKMVVPTRAALRYDGYRLNDILKRVGLNLGELAKSPYQKREFKTLQNYYDNAGVAHRGYELDYIKSSGSNEEFSIENHNSMPKDIIIYRANPINQFSRYTNKSTNLNSAGGLYVGEQFLKENSLSLEDSVVIKRGEKQLTVKLIKDDNIDAAYIGDFDEKIDIDGFFESRYAEFEVEKNG